MFNHEFIQVWLEGISNMAGLPAVCAPPAGQAFAPAISQNHNLHSPVLNGVGQLMMKQMVGTCWKIMTTFEATESTVTMLQEYSLPNTGFLQSLVIRTQILLAMIHVFFFKMNGKKTSIQWQKYTFVDKNFP